MVEPLAVQVWSPFQVICKVYDAQNQGKLVYLVYFFKSRRVNPCRPVISKYHFVIFGCYYPHVYPSPVSVCV